MAMGQIQQLSYGLKESKSLIKKQADLDLFRIGLKHILNCYHSINEVYK